jgi:hypothetical protein
LQQQTGQAVVVGVEKGDVGNACGGDFGLDVALHGGVICWVIWQTARLKKWMLQR